MKINTPSERVLLSRDNQIRAIQELYDHVGNVEGSVDELSSDKLNVPENTGTAGQILELGDDGETYWATITPGTVLDPAMSDDSPNPVENRAIKAYVDDELALGAVYDVSAKNPTAGPNNDGKWESLSALLSDANLNTLIPTSVRKGGMSIKFVCSSDNKYVQYFCKSKTFSTDTYDWEKVNLEKELAQIDTEINGEPDIEQPTSEDLHTGKYIDYQSMWATSESARYLMIDISNYRGKTIEDRNTNSNDLQYAFIVSYNDSSVVLSGGRVETKFTSSTIPNDANYLYIYFSIDRGQPILPELHIDGLEEGLVQEIQALEEIAPNTSIEKQEDVTESSLGVEPKLGYYLNYETPFWKELSGYNSWYFVAQSNCKIYVTDPNIFFVGIFNNGEVSSANFVVRMAKNGTGSEVLPTESSPYNVTAGQLITISTYNNKETFLLNLIEVIDGRLLSNNVFLNDNQINQVKDELKDVINENTDEMYVRKLTSSSIDVFRKKGTSPYFVMFHYEHRQKAFTANEYPSFYDNWGLMGSSIVTIFNNQITTILSSLYGSEAELAVNVTNPNGGFQYVGGYEHGFDNIITDNNGDRNFLITIDNTVVSESSTFELKPAGKIIIESNEELCQAYTNTNPFAIVYKKIEFSNTGVFVTNKLKLIRNMEFNNAMFGMMCLWRRYEGNTSNPYLVNKAIGNDAPFTIYTVDDTWKESGGRTGIARYSHDRSKVTEYGELGIGFSLKVVESTLKANGGMFVWHNGGAFDKIYFDLTGAYSGTQDEELSSTVEWGIYGKPVNPQ